MSNTKQRPNRLHVKKDDTVVVLSGKDKGKTGKVVKVDPESGKVVVEGVNVVKRHTKPRPPKVPRGGILEKAMPIDSCKVMLMCGKCNKAIRVKKEFVSDANTKVRRICRKCGEQV